MNKENNISSIILGLLLLALIIWGGYKIFLIIWDAFKTVDPTLATGIIAASATILVSILSVLIQKYIENKQKILNEHRNKVAPLYEKFISFMFQLLFAEKFGEKQLSEKESIKKFAEFTQAIVVWGSDDVIKAFFNFKNASINLNNASNLTLLNTVEDLLLAIRKDLGHSNKGLDRGKIMGLFINDIHTIIPNAGKE